MLRVYFFNPAPNLLGPFKLKVVKMHLIASPIHSKDLSVRPHERSRELLIWICLNLILNIFTKICSRSNLHKIRAAVMGSIPGGVHSLLWAKVTGAEKPQPAAQPRRWNLCSVVIHQTTRNLSHGNRTHPGLFLDRWRCSLRSKFRFCWLRQNCYAMLIFPKLLAYFSSLRERIILLRSQFSLPYFNFWPAGWFSRNLVRKLYCWRLHQPRTC
jgi:hypothetical protein